MNLKSFIYSYQLRLRQRLAARSCGSSPDRPIDPATFAPAKILFILSGLVGDSVMSISAIEVARRLWPEAVITVLGKRQNRELIAACGFFDEFYEFNADPFSLRRSDETRKLESWLAAQNFDAAIILLGDQFAHLLALAGIPVRVGVKGTPLEKCLTHLYDIGSPRTWGVIERLNSIRALGYEVECSLPRISIDSIAADSAVEKLLECGLTHDKYLVLHPFGSSQRQWWSLDNISEFAAKAKKKHNLDVVVIGGPETSGKLPIESSDVVIDTSGAFSLSELLAVIDGAELVVTTDSGPFHIAGALQKPTVGIFRSRRPEHANQYPSATVVFGENAECMKTCDWENCRSTPCRQMAEIPVDRVLDAVDARFDSV